MDEPEVNELSQQCFGNRLVLNMILTNLTFPDLKNARLVNRHWKREVDNVLSKRNNCIIRIKAGQSCHRLRELHEFLPSMSAPFVGLSISVDPFDYENSDCVNEHEFFTELVDSLPRLKYLELGWRKGLRSSVENVCSAGFYVSLFKRNANHVDALVLNNPIELMKRIFSDGIKLENLKTLIVKDKKCNLLMIGGGGGGPITDLVYSVLSAAPKLQEIQGIRFSSLVQVPRECHRAVREMNLYEYPGISQADLNLLADFILGPPNLTHLNIACMATSPEDFFAATLPRLLRASRESLKCIKFTRPLVATLIHCLRNGMDHPLVAVEKLHFNAGFANTTPEIRVQYARLISYAFPKLREVTVESDGRREDYAGLLRGYFWDTEPQAPIHSQVSRLVLVDECRRGILQTELSSLREIFPNVVELGYSTGEYHDLQTVFKLWTAWPRLQRLNLYEELSPNADYDAEFCGIFPEEAEQLRSQPPEYLKNVVIVPVRPAIYYLQDLKELRIRDNPMRPNRRRFNTKTFTQVTASLAFSRMRAEINITGDKSDEGLKRLAVAGIIHLDHEYSLDEDDADAYDNFV